MSNYWVSSDENGWGAICYSLVVVAVRSSSNWNIDGLRDSKKLTPEQREALRDTILQEVEKGNITYHLMERTNKQIDEMGCWNALKDAHKEALLALYKEGDRVIIDGSNLKLDLDIEIENIVKADDKIPACSAASILGKCYRDNIMIELAKQFPQYGWEKNKGYYDKQHILALEKFGITEHHRRTYKPVKTMIENNTAFYNPSTLTQ